jgi:double-stranded uracil-DNA glycosylase
MPDAPPKAGFAPLYQADARILILGSLPGDRSLGAQQYYAHPRNQFWPLMGLLLDQDGFASRDYPARCAVLAAHGIALWDVVAQGWRQASLDQHLRPVELNEVGALVQRLGKLRVIAFNGATAARIGQQLPGIDHLPRLRLPSTSPAHAVRLEVKAQAWIELRSYLGR